MANRMNPSQDSCLCVCVCVTYPQSVTGAVPVYPQLGRSGQSRPVEIAAFSAD